MSVSAVFCLLGLFEIGWGRENLPQKLYHYTNQLGAEKIHETGALKASTSSNGDAAFGDAVYATSLRPSNSKKAILDNNYGKETSANARKVDFVIELDVPSLQHQGYVVEPAKAGNRDIFTIHKGYPSDVDLGKVSHRILAKDDWMRGPSNLESSGSPSGMPAENAVFEVAFEAFNAKEATSIEWKVLACVGPACGQVQAHWLEWRSASSYYKYEKWNGGWRSTFAQSSEHNTRHTIEAKQCIFFWCSSSPVTHSTSSQAIRNSMIEESGIMFRTRTHTLENVAKQGACVNDLCMIQKTSKTLIETKSEGLFVDRYQIKETTCSNDVCSIPKMKQHSALAAPAKAGIGATVSSVISCTGHHLQKEEVTFETWTGECIPAAFLSGSVGLAIGVISKVPLVGPMVPVVMQIAGVLDACSESDSEGESDAEEDRCACEVGRTLAIAVPTVALGSVVPGGWLGASIMSGVIGGALPQCSIQMM